MAYTNSSLATYKNLTRHNSGTRNHKIDTITIHCMAGQMTGRGCADYFASTDRQVSSNYCIGYDGDIALSVEEKNRSWCSCSSSNDNRAITIEVATDSYAPYKCTDKAYNALLDLVTDICVRNGIQRLNYTGDTDGNMTKHKWFAATACPGAYLEGKFVEIQNEVNRRLGEEPDKKVLYRVQVGAFRNKENAEAFSAKLEQDGFKNFIVYDNDLYRVQVGAFSKIENAELQKYHLEKAGYEAFIKKVEFYD